KTVGEQAGLARALHDIEGCTHQGTTAEGEDHCVGVQRTQASEAGPGQVEVEGGPNQLCSQKDAQSQTDDTPDHRHDGELTYHLVVIGNRRGSSTHARDYHGKQGLKSVKEVTVWKKPRLIAMTLVNILAEWGDKSRQTDGQDLVK